MNKRWPLAVFSAVFVLSVIIGISLRMAVQKKGIREDFDDFWTSDATEKAPSETFSFEVSLPPAETATEPYTSLTVPTVTEPVEEDAGTVRICIGGDTSVNGEFADYADLVGVDYPWSDIAEVMSCADIAVVNLETCVSDRGVSEKREGYGFRTPPRMLEGFVNAGIDAVNLANNHTRDFGYDALLDTFGHLEDRGIDYFGAGNNLEEAEGLLIFEKNGVKIGFTGANRVYLPADCTAAEDHAGINQIEEMESDSTLAYIEKLKEYDSLCDVLIVFLHAGEEETFEATEYQKAASRAFIDAGADIVVGGHPHTVQPIEFYNEKLIIYSIGNLIFWHVDDDIDGLAAIFDITVGKGGIVSLRLHPVFIKNYKANYLRDGEGNFCERYPQIIQLANDLCNPNGLAFDGEGNMTEYAASQEIPAADE